ncbi:MAG: hypothetical protein ACKVS6_08155 [Planctomycetota bacterium]
MENNLQGCSSDLRAPRISRAMGFAYLGLLAIGIAGALSLLTSGFKVGGKAETYLFADGSNPTLGIDSDNEGVVDSVEIQFGTSHLIPDTDGDGASDLVETLYATNALNPLSFPGAAQLSKPRANITSYFEGDNYHIVVSLAVPNGDLSTVSNAGALLFAPQLYGSSIPQVVDLNPLILASSVLVQSAGPGSDTKIFSSDSWFPKSILNAFMGSDGFVQFSIAFNAVVNGTLIGDLAFFTTMAPMDSLLTSLAYLQIGAQSPGTGVFKPLSPVSLPPNWTPDSACFVTSELVAVEYGAVLVLQGTEANCEPQEGTICNPASCGELIGRIFRVVDPCTLGICF